MDVHVALPHYNGGTPVLRYGIAVWAIARNDDEDHAREGEEEEEEEEGRAVSSGPGGGGGGGGGGGDSGSGSSASSDDDEDSFYRWSLGAAKPPARGEVGNTVHCRAHGCDFIESFGSPIRIPRLRHNMRFAVALACRNQEGWGPLTARSAPVLIPPVTPMSVQVTDVVTRNGEAEVHFTKPSHDGGNRVRVYVVECVLASAKSQGEVIQVRHMSRCCCCCCCCCHCHCHSRHPSPLTPRLPVLALLPCRRV